MALPPKSTVFRTVLCAAMIAALSGCGGDGPTTPRNVVTPSFDNIWPAGVGNHWTYELSTHSVAVPETLYATAAEVPEVPAMELLYATLMAPVKGAPVPNGSGTFHLRFVEDISPSADLVAMRLAKETLVIAGDPDEPLALSIGATWLRSATQIGYYWSGAGDWVHLAGSLEPGHQFTVPLHFLGGTSSLATRVWRTRSYSALGTTYSNCIECFYVLDLGVYPVGTAYEIEGYFRPFAYGIVVYAPDLGPVYCHERIIFGTSTWSDREASLSDFATDAVSALEQRPYGDARRG